MIYMIRHAESTFNKRQKELFEELGPDYKLTKQYLEFKFDLKYSDSQITQLGFAQAQKCKQEMANIQIDLVIVSPMRRAIMTCHEIFKDHKSKPRILVDPAFRQVFDSSTDIGSLLSVSKQQYPYFDYSLIEDVDTWYIYSIKHPVYRQRIIKLVSQAPKEKKHEVARQGMVKILKQAREQKLKGNSQFRDSIVKNLTEQQNKLKQLLMKYRSIALVSHSENISSYVGYNPRNCQVVSVHQNKL